MTTSKKKKEDDSYKDAEYLCNKCKKWHKYKDYSINNQLCKKCLQKSKINI